MFRLPNNAIQKAMLENLKKYLPDLAIYDFVPADAKVPFVTIGNMVTSDDDAKKLKRYKVDMQINVWSEYRGKYEVNHIAQQIINVLQNSETAELDLSADDFIHESIAITNYEAYPEEQYGYNGVIQTVLVVVDYLEDTASYKTARKKEVQEVKEAAEEKAESEE